MNQDLDHILDECLEMMKGGASIEECLTRFSDHAEELHPLLITADAVQKSPPPPSTQDAKKRSHQKMMAAVDKQFTKQPVSASVFSRYTDQLAKLFRGIWPKNIQKEKTDMKLIIRFTVAAITAAILIVGGGATAASANSLPGDTLYPLKTTVEKAQLFLTLNPDTRQQLEDDFQEERLEEVEAVLKDGRIVAVEFGGTVTDVTEDSITIGDITIQLKDDTQIGGQLSAGSIVEVKAFTQPDGSLTAQFVEVENEAEVEDELEAEVEEETEVEDKNKAEGEDESEVKDENEAKVEDESEVEDENEAKVEEETEVEDENEAEGEEEGKSEADDDGEHNTTSTLTPTPSAYEDDSSNSPQTSEPENDENESPEAEGEDEKEEEEKEDEEDKEIEEEEEDN